MQIDPDNEVALVLTANVLADSLSETDSDRDKKVAEIKKNGGRALPGIISALEGAGIAVASVSLSRPSLDDVYLHFTGRDFNAEDRAA